MTARVETGPPNIAYAFTLAVRRFNSGTNNSMIAAAANPATTKII